MVQTIQGQRFQYAQIQSPETNRKIDLSNALEQIDYYEDILCPYTSMTLQIRATVNIVTELPITFGERFAMEVETGSGRFTCGSLNGNGDVDIGKGEFYVYKTSGCDTQKQSANFTLHLVSKEYFDNECEECPQKFGKDGGKPPQIDECVTEILNKNLKTEKKSFIEKTQNALSFFGNRKSPFYTIRWLAAQSISIKANGGEDGEDSTTQGKGRGTGGFLFYENKTGFHFRSIDGLVSSTKEYENSNGIGASDDKTINFDIHGTKEQPYEWRGLGAVDSNSLSSNFQIINCITEKTTDARKAIQTGVYCNEVAYYNVKSHEMSFYTYKLSEEIKDNKLGSDEVPVAPTVKDRVTRRFFRISDHGVTGQGKDGLEPGGGRNAERMAQAKSISRYNLLFTQSKNLSIPMNINIKAGDIIRCSFPRLNSGQTKESDEREGGKWLVRGVHHRFKYNLNVTFLKINKDSYGFSDPKVVS